MTDEPLKVVTLHDKLDNIADVVKKIPAQTFKKKLYIFLYGFLAGVAVTLSIVAFVFYEKPKKIYTVYYNTFYIQEKNGIRPAVLFTNYPIDSTERLDSAESKIFTRHNTGKTTGVMFWGESIPMRSPFPVKE